VVHAQRKASPSQQALLNYSAPTLVTRRDAGVPLQELLPAWYELWGREREAIMHLLAPFHASFMYSQHKFGAAFQAVEALHQPRFTGRELDRRSHQERVAAIVRAAQAAGVEDDTVAWAARVLRSRNDKPLTKKIEDVVRSAGACGEAVLKAAPTFPSTVAGERAGVSHPGLGRSLDAADRYWHGEVLTWIAPHGAACCRRCQRHGQAHRCACSVPARGRATQLYHRTCVWWATTADSTDILLARQLTFPRRSTAQRSCPVSMNPARVSMKSAPSARLSH
jgi:hypothetical protein